MDSEILDQLTNLEKMWILNQPNTREVAKRKLTLKRIEWRKMT